MALKGFLLAWIALGSAAHLRDLEIFEIDPATQAFEIQRIKDCGISLPPSVQYISAYLRRCSRERWCSGRRTRFHICLSSRICLGGSLGSQRRTSWRSRISIKGSGSPMRSITARRSAASARRRSSILTAPCASGEKRWCLGPTSICRCRKTRWRQPSRLRAGAGSSASPDEIGLRRTDCKSAPTLFAPQIRPEAGDGD